MISTLAFLLFHGLGVALNFTFYFPLSSIYRMISVICLLVFKLICPSDSVALVCQNVTPIELIYT